MVLPGSVAFRLKPHATSERWIAEQTALHHGGNFPDLDSAINYALFRGSGKLCRVELLNKAGRVQWLVVVDQSEHDPHAGIAPTWTAAHR